MITTLVNLDEIKKELETKTFKHASWFKEGKSVAYVLGYFAKNGWLEKREKKAKKNETDLFAPIGYEFVLRSEGSKAVYKFKNDSEILYFGNLHKQHKENYFNGILECDEVKNNSEKLDKYSAMKIREITLIDEFLEISKK